jgi:uncharacterized protein (TIGR03435 family)
MIEALANHLWQSTLFCGVAALVAVTLRASGAQVRYWVWFAASMKFLVPFALLATLAGALTRRAPDAPLAAAWRGAIEPVAEPFSYGPTSVDLAPVAASADSLLGVLAVVWAFGFGMVVVTSFWRWRALSNAVEVAAPLAIDAPLPVKAVPSQLPPGVFGIVRPALLLPHDIERRLTRAELATVVAHELCHVRRRDNLTAVLHLVVEAVFWFHPLAWWIGARLIAEREQACDEAVIAGGCERRTYAQAIIKVCKSYLAPSFAAAARASDGSLERRIEAIMTPSVLRPVGAPQRILIAGCALAIVAVSFGLGLGNAQPGEQAPVPEIEELTIRRGRPGMPVRITNDDRAHRFVAQNASLKELIGWAGPQQQPRQISQTVGGPEWLATQGFDVTLVWKPGYTVWGVVRYALQERFSLATHTESIPVYVLEAAENGVRMRESQAQAAVTLEETPGRIVGIAVSVKDFAAALSHYLQRPVLDHTKLSGRYDVALAWPLKRPLAANDDLSVRAAQSADEAVLASALDAQLGLRLSSFPVEQLVVDRASMPIDD